MTATSTPTRAKRELWSGRIGFILANIAAAVGLGSIWKFPYEVGANGGGAFVLFYLVGLALIVLPLMLAELALGRRGRSDAIRSILNVASSGRSLGAVGLRRRDRGGRRLSHSELLLGHRRMGDRVSGRHAAKSACPPATHKPRRRVSTRCSPLRSSWRSIILSSWRSPPQSSRAASPAASRKPPKILMPMLVTLIAALAIYSAIEGDLARTLRFLFVLDATQLKPQVALDALGLGFFSIGVGLCILITYAAYAGPHIDLRQVAMFTIVSDTAISFMAGFAVFPLVFAENLDPSGGPGLVFTTLAIAFARMPFGAIAAMAFFGLLTRRGARLGHLVARARRRSVAQCARLVEGTRQPGLRPGMLGGRPGLRSCRST